MLSKILTKEFNHQVIFISNGSEDLNLLSQDVYDLVFMDIDMPELFGIELSIKIRNSTLVMEQNKNEYIQKLTSPYKVQAVVEIVSHCL
ncbi:7961_t:CDS:2 [Gigaspora margarita]|uniref:7961_t:CDS:1 n=1 Tax=Gigaspora margarita TaxID=4874 RepID=A0ABN7VSJ7_GIGMA|nr:7961_t:CDS:2 [Gigaspora margarita]